MAHSSFLIAACAGAGTGKTYSLVENYVEALLGLDPSGIKKRPEQILALTFTQKAANEMRLRVAKRLNSFLVLKSAELDPIFLLCEKRGQKFPSHDEIRRLLRALPNAYIGTFHAFCADLLRKEAKALDLHDQFQILKPHEETTLAKNILRPLILKHIKEPHSAIRSLTARFRLNSGPSSLGLIDALIDCYRKLAENNLKVQELFDPKRRQAMQDTLQTDLNDVHGALSQFYATKLSDKTRERLVGFASMLSALTPLDLSDEMNFVHNFTRLKEQLKGNFGEASARRTLIEALHRFGAHVVDYFVSEDEEAVALLLGDFHHQLTHRKRVLAQLSYSDLLERTRDALAANTDLRRRVKQRFLHLLIDEYQDTSPLQEEIITYIAENKGLEQQFSRRDRPLKSIDFAQGSSLFIVGDKKQSIYGFRGADTTLFDAMVEKMANTYEPGERFYRRLLTINRRCAPPIIKLINLVAHHTLVDQGYEPDEDLQPHEDSVGSAALWLSADDGTLDKGEANVLTAAYGIAHLLKTKPDMNAKDIAVLTRRMSSAMQLREHLSQLGIASRIVGGEGFFQKQEIVDLLSALKLINDPAHELAAAIVFRSPLILLTDQDLMAMHRHADNGSINLFNAQEAQSAGLLSEQGGMRLVRFLATLQQLRAELMNQDLLWALDLLIESADLAFNIGLMEQAPQKWANITKLRAMVAGQSDNPLIVIEDYFAQVFNNIKEPQAPAPSESSHVTIMTIHQSKGLEFNVVVVADTESALPNSGADILAHAQLGLLVRPKGRPASSCVPKSGEHLCQTRFQQIQRGLRDKEHAEMARLLYVALTRARSQLYIVASKAALPKEEKNPKSMLDLFLRAYHREQKAFLDLCPIEIISKPQALSKPTLALASDDIGWECYESRKTTTRYFSSMLEAPPNWPYAASINRAVGSASHGIDGNLAHQIIAKSGPMLVSLNKVDTKTLNLLLSASLRSGTQSFDHAQCSLTLNACATTLSILHPWLKSARRSIFEMPIITRPSEARIIEGFADLVLEFDNYVGVIEFKSSVAKATDPNTIMQVLAYADGLAAAHQKVIKYSVMLIGSSQLITWRDYDEVSKQAFHQACLV